ncbi:uncharacterized protein LOC115261629 [Aedes albopictus]|uniref:HTH CENPB-type domain-containing protein n=1 Tax=Aedes albopictus TaxID=7160 RepID=A0ABM1ZUZ8_AEDAL
MSIYGTALTRNHVRNLAYQLAEQKQIKHRFCYKTELAGRDWLMFFMKRHPELTIRKLEPTSLARLKGFNRESVQRFFELLTKLYDSYEYPPSRICNADKAGFSTVLTRSVKVLAKKGVRQVAGVSSGERGANTTGIMALSASGQFLAPMLIFPRQPMNEAFKVGAPPKTIFACNGNGWSTTSTCSTWFDHFLAVARPTVDAPVLLILDGHSSHTRNLNMIEKARQNHVKILSIPPHTSHKFQPLDVSFMGPLKAKYANAVDNYLKRNPGKVVTIYNVSALVNEAFTACASVVTAQSGFRATGVYPINSHVFSDDDFATADKLIRVDEPNYTDLERDDFPHGEPSEVLLRQGSSMALEINDSDPPGDVASLGQVSFEEWNDASDILILDPSFHYSVGEDRSFIIHSSTTENTDASKLNETSTPNFSQRTMEQSLIVCDVSVDEAHESLDILQLDSSHFMLPGATNPGLRQSDCIGIEHQSYEPYDLNKSTQEIFDTEFNDAEDILVLDPSIYYSVAEDGTVIRNGR